MTVTNTEMLQACRRIMRSRELSEKRYKAYYLACRQYDWAAVERLRLEIIANVEAFLDEIAAAHKFIEVSTRGKNKKR